MADQETFYRVVLPMTEEQIEAENQRVLEKGHDCWESVVHEWDPSLRGGHGNDVYLCAVCGDVLQVG